jgi:hypothetical protein
MHARFVVPSAPMARQTVWRVVCRLLCSSAAPAGRDFERSVAHGNAGGHELNQAKRSSSAIKWPHSRASQDDSTSAMSKLTRLNADP